MSSQTFILIDHETHGTRVLRNDYDIRSLKWRMWRVWVYRLFESKGGQLSERVGRIRKPPNEVLRVIKRVIVNPLVPEGLVLYRGLLMYGSLHLITLRHSFLGVTGHYYGNCKRTLILSEIQFRRSRLQKNVRKFQIPIYRHGISSIVYPKIRNVTVWKWLFDTRGTPVPMRRRRSRSWHGTISYKKKGFSI